ncbi:MAG: hypothetical protein B6241_05960 [Spirochaetaceae bacterium 4572_59]|nr:MAG: hypothetical protein B6241_05960 [Spirochaetaceae bacterium 4572_59]
MPTIKDIAEKLNISYSTVSLALRDSPKVKKKTLKLVKQTADEIGYRPNCIARSLVLQKSILVAMITPDISSPFYARIVEGAEAACRKKGYNMLICNTNWDPKWEEKHLNLILERRIDGAVIAPCKIKNDYLDKILSAKLPIAFVSSQYPHKDKDNLIFRGADNIEGGYLATCFILKKKQKAIAFIGGSINSVSLVHRMEGYYMGIDEADFPRENVYTYTGDFSQNSGYENSLKALHEHPEITCLICLNDLIAMGALKASRETGRKVPEDIGIIGYDDTYLASLDAVQLTSVYQPKYQMGYEAMNKLLDRLESDEENEPLSKLLHCKLSIRNSV